MMTPHEPSQHRPQPRRRGHLRVDVGPTGQPDPDGDQHPTAEVTRRADQARPVPTPRVKKSTGHAQLSERDRWMLEQRPPHWG